MGLFDYVSKGDGVGQPALIQEWIALPDSSKAEILVVIQATNIIKANPALDGNALLTLVAKATGEPYVDSFLHIVPTVAEALGIVVPAGTSPVAVVSLITAFLASKTGNSWDDAVLALASYTAVNLVTGGGLSREDALTLMQWAYTNIYKPAIVVPSIPAPILNAVEILTQLPSKPAIV